MHSSRGIIFACLLLFVIGAGGKTILLKDTVKELPDPLGHRTNLHSVPYVTLTDANGKVACVGTLISPIFVLTTASCVDSAVTGFDKEHFVANIGIRGDGTVSWSRSGGRRRAADKAEDGDGVQELNIGITSVVVHENYRSGGAHESQYDVAFVKLDTPSKIHPAVVPVDRVRGCIDGHLATISASSGAMDDASRSSIGWKQLFYDSSMDCMRQRVRIDVGRAETFCVTADEGPSLDDVGSGVFCLQGPQKPPIMLGMVTRGLHIHSHTDSHLVVGISPYIPWISQNAYASETSSDNKMNDEEQSIQTRQLKLTSAADAEYGQFPYAVAVFPRGFIYECNGALIGPRAVLTLASCVLPSIRRPSRVKALVGDIHIAEGRRPEAEKIEAESIHVHPEFKSGLNLAILVLRVASNWQPISLPNTTNSDCYTEGKRMSVYSWGPATEGKQSSSVLQTDFLGYLSHDDCAKEHDLDGFTPMEVCGSRITGGASLCARDDGTGLVCTKENGKSPAEDVLIGISGQQNGRSSMCAAPVSRFINVRMALDWIQEVQNKIEDGTVYVA